MRLCGGANRAAVTHHEHDRVNGGPYFRRVRRGASTWLVTATGFGGSTRSARRRLRRE